MKQRWNFKAMKKIKQSVNRIQIIMIFKKNKAISHIKKSRMSFLLITKKNKKR